MDPTQSDPDVPHRATREGAGEETTDGQRATRGLQLARPALGGNPLWQNLLSAVVLAAVVVRAVMTFTFLASAGSNALVVAYGLQVILGVATAVGIRRGRPWAVAPLVALGAAVIATTLLETFALGIRPAVNAVSEVLFVALATGALAYFLKREFRSA